MRIAVLNPKSEFSNELQAKLNNLGDITYTESRREYPIEELTKLVNGAEILAVDPDNLGGFEKAKEPLTKVMEALPNLKGLALSTTAYGWIDLGYCKKRKIPVSNVPGYSLESVAEHALALMLNLAKRIMVTDRKTREGRYQLEMGFELKGKTLGIIGLGNIGSRMAELAQGIGMKVISYNRSPRNKPGVEMVTLPELLRQADAISLHVTDSDEAKNMINNDSLSDEKRSDYC